MFQLPHTDPGTPDTQSPGRFIRWMVFQQWRTLSLQGICTVINALCGVAQPFVLGWLVDDVISTGLSSTLWRGMTLLAGVGTLQIVSNILAHRFGVRNWLTAAFRVDQLLTNHAARSGSNLTDTIPTGEVAASVANDSARIADFTEVSTRLIGSLIAFLAAVTVLFFIHPVLAMTVLIGLPVMALLLAGLVKPIALRQAQRREHSGALTALGADTVAGLRILRGIGGEVEFARRYAEKSQNVKHAGIRVAQLSSVLGGMQTLLPGLFTVLVMAVAAHLALAGEISVGMMATFYGIAAFLGRPLWEATESLNALTQSTVGSARVLRILAVAPSPAHGEVKPQHSSVERITLRDETSGVEVLPGRLTVLVAPDPDVATELAHRFGGMQKEYDDDGNSRGVMLSPSVKLNGVPLTELDPEVVRGTIVVSDSTPFLFSGPLREEIDLSTQRDQSGSPALAVDGDPLDTLMFAVSGEDIVESLPEGLDSEITEKGRSLSGGQRQRLALARTLSTNAPVLVLVEPTSAVDAHTESRIAQRLRGLRTGKTTLVVSASPLLLDQADAVILLDEEGLLRASGTHRELLNRGDDAGRAYRAVVSRAVDGEEKVDATTGEEAH